LKRLVQRYLIAAVGFVVAALWLGVGLPSALECLLAFLLTLLVVTVVQRRQRVVARGGHVHRPASGHRHARRPETAGPGDRRYPRRSRSRSGPSRPLYDDEAAGGDWPRLPERHW
jgi:hypothetical protein